MMENKAQEKMEADCKMMMQHAAWSQATILQGVI